MWELEPTPEYTRKLKKWPKKYRRELTAMLDNLDTFLQALNLGAKPQQAKFGFIHTEPLGVLAIDQRGAGAGTKATRLYVYPDEGTETVHTITLGDKDSQRTDIKISVELVRTLKENEADSNG